MTNLAIAANGLRKSYGDKVVLDGVDLAVPERTIFTLLGQNGSGKTTAVKILSTLISADPGTGGIHIGGHDLANDPQVVRATIGVTGQFSAVDNLITGEENMLLMADLHHLSRSEGRRTAAELLELLYRNATEDGLEHRLQPVCDRGFRCRRSSRPGCHRSLGRGTPRVPRPSVRHSSTASCPR